MTDLHNMHAGKHNENIESDGWMAGGERRDGQLKRAFCLLNADFYGRTMKRQQRFTGWVSYLDLDIDAFVCLGLVGVGLCTWTASSDAGRASTSCAGVHIHTCATTHPCDVCLNSLDE